MVNAGMELKKQLLKAGKLLISLPNELLNHLNEVEKLLQEVYQSPSKSMLTVLSPIITALVEVKLLRNENEDVRVAVASCFCEITRITCPNAPYEDNLMEEVFRLIVSSFKNLSDNSNQSYSKRTSILENVCRLQLCMIMLDIECDGLIVEMFQHFLKEIRDHHPENVFSFMENIMTLVLKECKDVELELISPMLTHLEKDNQEVHPIARNLAKNVIRKCSELVKPCLLEAKSSMNFSFDDYNTIISEICMETDYVKISNHKSSGELDKMTKESEAKTLDGQDHHSRVVSGPKTENEDVPASLCSLDKPEHTSEEYQLHDADANVAGKAEPGDLYSGKVAKMESTSVPVSKKNTKLPTNLKLLSSDIAKDSKPVTEVPDLPSCNPPTMVVVVKENDKETKQFSSPKAFQSEPENVFSPSPSKNALDEGHSRKDGKLKKQQKLSEKASPSEEVVTKMITEGTNTPGVKLRGQSGKKAQIPVRKVVARSSLKTDGTDHTMSGSSSKKKADDKQRVDGKTTPENVEAVSSSKPSKAQKDDSPLNCMLKACSKRKRTPSEEKATDVKKYGEDMVGARMEVFCPTDDMCNERSSQDGGEGTNQPLTPSMTPNPCIESRSKCFSQQKYIFNMWEILTQKLSKCRLEDLSSFEKTADKILKTMEETTTVNLSFLRTVVNDFFVTVHEYDQQRLLSMEVGFTDFSKQTFKEKNEHLEAAVADEGLYKTKVADFKKRLAIIATEMKRLNAEKDEVKSLLAKEEDKMSRAQSTIASLSMDLSKLEDQCLQSYKVESNIEKISKCLEIRLEELMKLTPFR